MQITLNVDSATLEKIVNEGLKELDTKEIEDICKDTLVVYFTNPEVLDKLLIKKSLYGQKELTSFAESLIKKVFEKDDEWKAKIKENVFNYLTNNYMALVNKAIAEAVASEIFGNGFRQHVINTIMSSDILRGR